MIRLFGSMVLMCISVPAVAGQDLASDALSSASSYAGTVAVNSHLNRRGSKNARSTPADQRRKAACAGLPGFVARHGADDPRVVTLGKFCRKAGYIR